VLLPPLSATETTVVKAGSLSVRFQIYDATGASMTDLKPVLRVAKWIDGEWGTEFDPTSTSAPKAGVTFRYDPVADLYVYNLNTKALGLGTYRLRILPGYGGEIYAQIQVVK
jgi:hypothetical protein